MELSPRKTQAPVAEGAVLPYIEVKTGETGMSLRIRGLVRAYNNIRAQLEAGLPDDSVDAFRAEVAGLVGQVEQLCRAHGLTPDALPAPSRNAYRFLSELDLDDLPIREAGTRPMAARPIRVRNVVSIANDICRQLWCDLDELSGAKGKRETLQARIEEHVGTIERICADSGGDASLLKGPTRLAYCWLKFLTSVENFHCHLEALRRARKALRRHPLPQKQTEVHLTAGSSLWRTARHGNVYVVKCNEGFVHSGQEFWDSLFRASAAGDRRNVGELLRRHSLTDEFELVVLELESYAQAREIEAGGRVHNLDESFARVNRDYFDGKMEKPRLAWSRAPTTRTFGHYQFARDRLVVSVSLDDASVPQFLVDFIVYHELLHKKHGITERGGRRYAHTKAFRTDEKRFSRYAEAKEFLKELAEKLN